ncbi:MAG: crossover junction endodeoxyribonuclease RuvC [Chitinophagaceae bacterium]
MQKPSKIILGIDPGTLIMGYSVIEVCNNVITVKEMDVLRLTSKKNNHQRLQLIHKKVIDLVILYSPDEFAIEAPFFGKNVQSMLKLGRAQGVAIAAAMNYEIPVTEYSPKRVKQSITGNGNADKEQIWKMLHRLVVLIQKPKYFDATDALAVAVCHHYSKNNLSTKNTTLKKKKGSAWEKFVLQNPERIL